MTQRMPTPGSDGGDWGDILNAFLGVSHANDGTLNSNTVGTSQIQAGAVTNSQLDTPTQTAIASVASKYVKPVNGIPANDLNSAVQTNLNAASTAVQSSQLGASSGVATLDGTSKLTSGQLPSSVITSVGASDKQILKYLTSAGKAVFVNPQFVDPVADFGADPTGVADSTTAINNALSAAASLGWPVQIPYGNFLVSAKLSITAPNIVIKGMGRSVTQITAAAGIGTNEVLAFSSAASGATVSDLKITASTSNNTSVIHLAGASSNVERVTIAGAGTGSTGAQGGILVDSTATGTKLVRCDVTGILNSSATYGTGFGIRSAANDTLIENCAVSNCGSTYYAQQAGLFLSGVSGTSGQRIRVIGGSFFSNGVHGIYATGCDYITIDGAYCHDNGAVSTAAGGVSGSDFGRGITIGTAAAYCPKIVNCTLYNNQENGMIVGSLTVIDCIVSNNCAYNNNLGQFAGGHGIEVDTLGGTVSGNVCYGNHNGISTSGINITVTGNHCYGNTSSDTTQGSGIHINFPSVSVTVNSVTLNNGSTAATVSSGGFPGVMQRMVVSGTGIAGSATTVQSLSGNTLTLSAAATATGTVSLTFALLYLGVAASNNVCHDNDNNGLAFLSTSSTYYGAMASNNNLYWNGVQQRTGARYDLYVDSSSRYGTFINNFTNNSSALISIGDTYAVRNGNQTNSDNAYIKSLSYSTSISWIGESSNLGLLAVTNTTAFTINVPSTAFTGRVITYEINNNSGGTMGVITWGSGFLLAGAFTNPAAGFRRMITFVYDGSSWRETSRSAADGS